MRASLLCALSAALLAVLVASVGASGAFGAQGALPEQPRPVVLVLADGLSWGDVEKHGGLGEVFGGASAVLSVVQGSSPPDDPRFGYVFLGAGSRVDTRVLPQSLPVDPARIPGAFDGPAGTVRPGALGDALKRARVEAAAIGPRARLVAMDSEGEVPTFYGGEEPLADLEMALEGGADFVAVDAGSPTGAAALAEAVPKRGATILVASPNGPPESPYLTPFAFYDPGSSTLLYSPTTRAKGLLTNADVAPTVLAALDVPVPPEMTGRTAEVRPLLRPEDPRTERLQLFQRRLSFVTQTGLRVWWIVGLLWTGALAVGIARGGRKGASWVVLALAGLPVGALLAAVLPATDAAPVAGLTALFAFGLAGVCRRLGGGFRGGLVLLSLATAALVALDAAAGGALMRFATIGYNPATGTRFYGLGNEYAAVLAGALTFGLGTLSRGGRRQIPSLAAPLAALGGVFVLVVGLPTMGADVGGSLALGLCYGATLGLISGSGIRGVALRAAGGLAFAAALFLASGVLFPGVSHGSQAASSVGEGGGGLPGVLLRKLGMSLEYLSNPVLLALLAGCAVVIFAGRRRARGTPLAVGMLSAAIAAAASAALNDSGIVAALFAMIYPLVAALGVLVSEENAGPG